MKTTLLAFAALTLAACAGTTHQVVATGPDTFMVASHGVMGWSSGPAQKAKAIEDATAYCEARGKHLRILESKETEGGYGKIASSELNFRCE